MRWARAVATAGLAALLVGCTAQVGVDLTITGAQAARVVVAAEFTDEAAAVLDRDEATLEELTGAFTDRTGTAPRVSSTPDRVRVWSDVDYEALADSAGITGVGQVRLSGQDRQVQAAVELVDAPQLREAVQAAVAGEVDGEAVWDTMARGTQLVVTVHFPGGLNGDPQVIGVSSDAVSVDGGTVRVVRTLSDPVTGAVVVTGDPQAPPPWGWVVAAGGVVLIVGGAVWARRRDQADPLTGRR